MKSYILLETAAIFFSSEPFSKQGISLEYAKDDFICMGLLDLFGMRTENHKKIHPTVGFEPGTFRLRNERAKS